MRSIGIFWKRQSVKDADEECYTCPYKVDDFTPVASNARKANNAEFILQLNLWNINVRDISTKKDEPFKAIDIGIVSPLYTNEIAILLPFKIEKDDFCDLAKCLSLDSDLLCTVFNEDLKSVSEPDKSYHTIECDKFKYIMYELSDDNIVENSYDPKTDMTLLVIRINSNFNVQQFNGYSLFVRFRIKLRDFKTFASKEEISNDWLQAAFSSTYMFDIRVNDVRELSNKKKELVESKGFELPKFSKVHFFYMANSEETIENGSSIKLDSRLLENNRWHSYIGKGLEFTSPNIAHHWKKTKKETLRPKSITNNGDVAKVGFGFSISEINDFALFFKTEFSEPKNTRILLYLSIIVLLGIISSAIVSIGAFFEHCVIIWCSFVIVVIGILALCLFRKHFHR